VLGNIEIIQEVQKMSDRNQEGRRIFNFNDRDAYSEYVRGGLSFRGVTWLQLSYSDATKTGAYFLHFASAGEPFVHDHRDFEELLVLQGSIKDDAGREYVRGDFIGLTPLTPFTSFSSKDTILLCSVHPSSSRPPELADAFESKPIVRSIYDKTGYSSFFAYGKPYPNVDWLPLTKRDTGVGSYFASYQPPARSRPHEHQGSEEFLVFEGEFNDHDGTLFKEGDFVVYAAGTQHYSYASAPALLHVIMASPNRRLDAAQESSFEAKHPYVG